MALDLAALKAKLAAKTFVTTTGDSNEISKVPVVSEPKSEVVVTNSSRELCTNVPAVHTAEVPVESSNSSAVTATVTAPAKLGTSKTSELDHLDFLAKMNKLAETIQSKHPTMPVLLMQIHKQIRSDPELATTLDEDAIGIIVSGLQIHTKTELVSVVIKESKKKSKAVSVEMF